MATNGTIYSDPRVTTSAKGLLEDPPKIEEYREAVDITVNEVVSAIMERINKEVETRHGAERKG